MPSPAAAGRVGAQAAPPAAAAVPRCIPLELAPPHQNLATDYDFDEAAADRLAQDALPSVPVEFQSVFLRASNAKEAGEEGGDRAYGAARGMVIGRRALDQLSGNISPEAARDVAFDAVAALHGLGAKFWGIPRAQLQTARVLGLPDDRDSALGQALLREPYRAITDRINSSGPTELRDLVGQTMAHNPWDRERWIGDQALEISYPDQLLERTSDMGRAALPEVKAAEHERQAWRDHLALADELNGIFGQH
ncbi:MAG TPA: hypothetical protein VGO93_25025 [Candidatus Xenobia bacterium]